MNSIPSIMRFLGNLDGVSFGYFLSQYLMAQFQAHVEYSNIMIQNQMMPGVYFRVQ